MNATWSSDQLSEALSPAAHGFRAQKNRIKPNVVVVSVHYGDCLSITLPYNRHHFSKVVVVTTPDDEYSGHVALSNDCVVLRTDIFHRNGAPFAKYDGIEAGLNTLGREGWVALMDADILLPKAASFDGMQIGHLYGAHRRMCPEIMGVHEEWWSQYSICRRLPEHWFSGYLQVFHADDPHLGLPPWHGSGHKTAADGDGVLMRHWEKHERLRLPFEVLHLGPAMVNWSGRKECQATQQRAAT